MRTKLKFLAGEAIGLSGGLGMGVWWFFRWTPHSTWRPVGAAVASATGTRLLSLFGEWRTSRVADEEARRRGLDETRRLLYMAHFVALRNEGRQHFELIGTLVSSLVYHLHLLTPVEAQEFAAKVISGAPVQEEVGKLIDRITEMLSDGPAASTGPVGDVT